MGWSGLEYVATAHPALGPRRGGHQRPSTSPPTTTDEPTGTSGSTVRATWPKATASSSPWSRRPHPHRLTSPSPRPPDPCPASSSTDQTPASTSPAKPSQSTGSGADQHHGRHRASGLDRSRGLTVTYGTFQHRMFCVQMTFRENACPGRTESAVRSTPCSWCTAVTYTVVAWHGAPAGTGHGTLSRRVPARGYQACAAVGFDDCAGDVWGWSRRGRQRR